MVLCYSSLNGLRHHSCARNPPITKSRCYHCLLPILPTHPPWPSALCSRTWRPLLIASTCGSSPRNYTGCTVGDGCDRAAWKHRELIPLGAALSQWQKEAVDYAPAFWALRWDGSEVCHVISQRSQQNAIPVALGSNQLLNDLYICSLSHFSTGIS